MSYRGDRGGRGAAKGRPWGEEGTKDRKLGGNGSKGLNQGRKFGQKVEKRGGKWKNLKK